MSQKPPRISVFDFGSNSIKFGLFSLARGGRLRRIDGWRIMMPLGEDVFAQGRISEAMAERVEAALARLRESIGAVDGSGAAATSAMRTAENGQEMARRFSRALGVEIQIVDGQAEARLLARGVLGAGRWDRTAEALVLDIGGGSAEIVRAAPGKPLETQSLELGSVRLRADHDPPDDDQPYSAASIESLESAVASALEATPPMAAGARCFGAGGGFTTLTAMIHGKRSFRPGFVIQRHTIQELALALRGISPQAAAERYGLPQRRSRIMQAGATAAWRALERLGAGSAEVSYAGLLEGLAAEVASRLDGGSTGEEYFE